MIRMIRMIDGCGPVPGCIEAIADGIELCLLRRDDSRV